MMVIRRQKKELRVHSLGNFVRYGSIVIDLIDLLTVKEGRAPFAVVFQ